MWNLFKKEMVCLHVIWKSFSYFKTNARHLSSKSTESDLEETVWDETAGDESSSSTSSDTSGDEVTSEEEEVTAKHHGTGASLSHLEDPFKIFHAASSSTSVSNSGKGQYLRA